MAAVPFVDTHVHFWDREAPELAGAYEWLDPHSGTLDPEEPLRAIAMPRYRADDFAAETRFANVSKVVHVQAAIGIDDPVGETAWLQAAADRTGTPHGIVAYADLTAPDAAEMLERHCRHANVRGIRDFRSDDYLTNPDWHRGLALLGPAGLVLCDGAVVEEAGELVADVARRHGEVTYCIDHTGFPRRRDDDYFRSWRTAIRRIAAVPSTVIKISGLGMCESSWTVDSIRPWVLECIDSWGVDRAFFGTNWPIDRMFSSYGDVVDAYAEIIADFTADEQAKLFHRNAERIFRLA